MPPAVLTAVLTDPTALPSKGPAQPAGGNPPVEETLGASPGDPADTQRGAEQAPPTLAGRPLPHGLLVVGDAAVDDRLLAGVHDDERQVDD